MANEDYAERLRRKIRYAEEQAGVWDEDASHSAYNHYDDRARDSWKRVREYRAEAERLRDILRDITRD